MQAEVLTDLIRRSDCVCVLIDISSAVNATDQLLLLQNVFRQVRLAPTRHGSRQRPVLIAFTKPEQVLHDIQALDLNTAKSMLMQSMRNTHAWRGVANEISSEFRREGHRYREFMPVSCFGHWCDPATPPQPQTIRPKFLHESLAWSLDPARRLALGAGVRRVVKWAAIVAACVLFLIIVAAGVFHLVQESETTMFVGNTRGYEKVRKENTEPSKAAYRLTRGVEYLRENSSNSFADKNKLAEVRNQCVSDRKLATELDQADREAYSRVQSKTPITSWQLFEEALTEAQTYCEGDRDLTTRNMATNVEALRAKLTTFKYPKLCLNVKVKRVDCKSDVGSEKVEVVVANTSDINEKSAVGDVVVNYDFNDAFRPRPLLELHVQRGDKAPVFVTVKKHGVAVASKRIQFGNVLFEPDQEVRIVLDDTYIVTLVVNCPDLQNLNLPPFQATQLSNIPD